MYEYLFYIALFCIFFLWFILVKQDAIEHGWENIWIGLLIIPIILTPLTPIIAPILIIRHLIIK